jgi:hypothetical protein
MWPIDIGPSLYLTRHWGEPPFTWFAEPFDYILPTIMTAILMWQTGDETFIAADGLAWSEKGNHFQTDLKTARVNDFAVVAARGDTFYSNQIFGHLFDVYDESGVDRWPFFIQELERRNISRPDLDLRGIASIISGCCASIERDIQERKKGGGGFTPFDGDIVLLSCTPGHIAAHGWREQGVHVLEGIDMSKPVVLAPGSDEVRARVRKVLRSACLSPEAHVKKAMRLIAAESDRVNENVTLRRSSRGFVLERLY